ncbi:MAG TPA: hypothetical protein EYG97_04125 [Arcobacter sp.]|nr:hypothetical protein [Arcobacter sp.]HIP56191.1 hypothetical protein [Arcobacter sp.]
MKIAIINLKSYEEFKNIIEHIETLEKEIINVKISLFIDKQYEQDFLHLDEKYDLCTLDMKDMNILDLKFKLDKIKYYAREKYDIAIDTQGTLKTSIIAYLLSGRTAGFKISGFKGYLATLLYDEKIDRKDEIPSISMKKLLSKPFGFSS